MRFVPNKSVEQQGCLMLHRVRHLFISQQAAVISAPFLLSRDCRPGRAQGVELEIVADTRSPSGPACFAALGRRFEGPNPGVRPTHHRLALIKRDEQTAAREPRRRAFRSGREFSA